jgi:eukaryotic-like serine/threonine-protein kinase
MDGPDNAGRPDNFGRPGNGGRPNPPGRGGPPRPDVPGRPGRPDDPDRTEYIGRADPRPDDPGRPGDRGREAAEEQSLHVLLGRRRFGYSEVARLGAQVADALARGHAQGDPHGAVSPDCVMISRDGRARLVAPSGRPVETAYLSPERVRGEPVGAPADVYALGLVLLETATGHQVFPGDTPAAAEARLYHQPMVPNDVPGPLARALLAMTETDPMSRPSAGRAAEMLAGVPSAGVPVEAPIPAGPPYGKIAAIGLPVLVLLILLAVALWPSDDSAKNAAGSASSSATATATADQTTEAEPTTTSGSDDTTDTTEATGTTEPTRTSGRTSGHGRPTMPGLPSGISLPSNISLPKIDSKDLPDLPSSASVTDKIQHAWQQFTDWLSGLV